MERKLKMIQSPALQPGFLGKGHLARPVIQVSFDQSDPFILLMDDMLDKQDDAPAGGPHPHAGFETVSLLIDGEIGGSTHKMKAGDLEMMTAGSGVVHTETIEKKVKLRLLQLWLTLPQKDRGVAPRVQNLPMEHVPQVSYKGTDIRVYMGSFAGVSSPIQNFFPVIIADIILEEGAITVQQLPVDMNAFLYVIEGSIKAGKEGYVLKEGQVGWLERVEGVSESELTLTGADQGGRVVLYAGQPQGDRIVSHGPFIGNTQEDIVRFYREYKLGMLRHVSTLPKERVIEW